MSLITVDFPASRYRSGKYKVSLSMSSGSIPEPLSLHAKIIELGELEIGSDESNESVYFPNNMSLKFLLDERERTTWSKLFSALRTNEALYIFEREISDAIWSTVWFGYTQPEAVTGDYWDGTFTVKAYDPFYKQMKAIDPKTNPFGYTLSYGYPFTDILFDAFNSLDVFSLYSTIDIIPRCEYIATAESGVHVKSFSDFYIPAEFYFRATDNIYNTNMEVLKSIAAQFGCLIYLGLYGKVYMLPRFYPNSTTSTYRQLPVQSIKKGGIQVIPYKIMKGLTVNARAATFRYVTGNYGDVSSDPGLVEIFNCDSPVGELPGGGESASNMLIKADGTLHWADMDSVRRSDTDTVPTSLWRKTAEDVWSIISSGRFGQKVVLGGIDADVVDYWKDPWFNQYWRFKKAKYNFVKNRTELTITNC